MYPTLGRTKTIGEKGSSEGQFYSKYLSRIVLNEERVAWHEVDLKGLRREEYREKLMREVKAATEVEMGSALREAHAESATDVKVFFEQKQYKRLANELRLMNDLKEGIPRSSFEGIVRLHTLKGANLFLVPKSFDS